MWVAKYPRKAYEAEAFVDIQIDMLLLCTAFILIDKHLTELLRTTIMSFIPNSKVYKLPRPPFSAAPQRNGAMLGIFATSVWTPISYFLFRMPDS